MATVRDTHVSDEPSTETPAETLAEAAPALRFPHNDLDPRGAAEAALREFDERRAARAERERRMHLPTRIIGESAGDHVRRGAPVWADPPEVMPLGEEGGTAWTPDNAWLREEQEV